MVFGAWTLERMRKPVGSCMVGAAGQQNLGRQCHDRILRISIKGMLSLRFNAGRSKFELE